MATVGGIRAGRFRTGLGGWSMVKTYPRKFREDVVRAARGREPGG